MLEDKTIILYEDELWLVLIPKTLDGLYKYSDGTSWSYDDERNQISIDSNLFLIIINKNKNVKEDKLAKVKITFASEKSCISYFNTANNDVVDKYSYLNSLPQTLQNILKTYNSGLDKFYYTFLQYIRYSDNVKAKALFKEKNINISINYGESLMTAVIADNYEMVKFLIENGVNVHAQKDRALIIASYNNYNNIATLLIRYGANIHVDNDSIFIDVLQHSNNITLAEYFLKHKVDINTQNGQALVNAALRKNLEMVKFLLENGANVHAQEDMALINACFNKHYDIIELLLFYGANKHAQNNFLFKNLSRIKYFKVFRILKKY